MTDSKNTVDLTAENFATTVNKEDIVLVDWWAPWCQPCRGFAPVYDAVAARHPDIVFAKVNTEEQPALASALHIESIPTLMILRDGVLLFAQPGALPEEALEELIARARDLDMEDVRRKIAEAESAQAAPPPPR